MLAVICDGPVDVLWFVRKAMAGGCWRCKVQYATKRTGVLTQKILAYERQTALSGGDKMKFLIGV